LFISCTELRMGGLCRFLPSTPYEESDLALDHGAPNHIVRVYFKFFMSVRSQKLLVYRTSTRGSHAEFCDLDFHFRASQEMRLQRTLTYCTPNTAMSLTLFSTNHHYYKDLNLGMWLKMCFSYLVFHYSLLTWSTCSHRKSPA
jgi:hypothetical protein